MFSGREVLYASHQAFQLMMPIGLTRQLETMMLEEVNLGAWRMCSGTEHLLHRPESLATKQEWVWLQVHP